MQALEAQIATANAALVAEQAKNAELQSKYGYQKVHLNLETGELIEA